MCLFDWTFAEIINIPIRVSVAYQYVLNSFLVVYISLCERIRFESFWKFCDFDTFDDSSFIKKIHHKRGCKSNEI